MKGRTPPPRKLPADADDRRIAAALKAVEGISTTALEAGLVVDALDALGMVQTAMAIAAEVSSQGKNPARYVDFARAVRQFAPSDRRLEASGFTEHLNKAWERRTGEKLGEQPSDRVLTPLRSKQRTPAA